MFARLILITALFALFAACSSAGGNSAARQVGGEFRSSNSVPVRNVNDPEASPTFPVPGKTGVSLAEARRLAEERLRAGALPLIEGGILAREIHFATREEMVVLSGLRVLGFSISSLPPTSELFWIVNFLDFRDDDEPGTYSGAVIDAETGEALVTFLNRGIPMGSK